MIRSWSKDQDIIAMGSAEAELHAATYGVMQLKGLQSISIDLGKKLEARVHIDASAAIGVMKRQGLGKLRHIQVRDLWLQSEIKEGRLMVSKVATNVNPAGLGTKLLGVEVNMKHMEFIGLRFG